MRGSMRRSSEEDIESGARQPGWQSVTPQPGPRVGANLIIPAVATKAMHSQNHPDYPQQGKCQKQSAEIVQAH